MVMSGECRESLSGQLRVRILRHLTTAINVLADSTLYLGKQSYIPVAVCDKYELTTTSLQILLCFVISGSPNRPHQSARVLEAVLCQLPLASVVNGCCYKGRNDADNDETNVPAEYKPLSIMARIDWVL